jgi:hypothetical protein
LVAWVLAVICALERLACFLRIICAENVLGLGALHSDVSHSEAHSHHVHWGKVRLHTKRRELQVRVFILNILELKLLSNINFLLLVIQRKYLL